MGVQITGMSRSLSAVIHPTKCSLYDRKQLVTFFDALSTRKENALLGN